MASDRRWIADLIAVQEGRFPVRLLGDDAVRALDLMNKKFDGQYRNVPSTPENADFLKSPQYREWSEKNGNAGESENAGE